MIKSRWKGGREKEMEIGWGEKKDLEKEGKEVDGERTGVMQEKKRSIKKILERTNKRKKI